MAPRKKRQALKLDAASEFLRDFLTRGPTPANEVKTAALENGISVSMLEKVPQSIVTKAQEMGPDGARKWYWKLRTSRRRVQKSRETVHKDMADDAGYQRAVSEMLRRLAGIVGSSGKKLTAKQLITKFDEELHDMKERE
jgi:hypothetical protein